MDETELDKTEQATPFKLKRARERGAVARSMDLGFFAALAAAIGFLWVGGAALAMAIAHASGETLASAGALGHDPQTLGTVSARLAMPVIRPLVTFAGALFGIALVLDFVQVGPVFSAHPLKPDLSRINPAKGIKRLFSWRMLVEALKATFKLAVYAVIAWLVIGEMVSEQAVALADAPHFGAVLVAALLRLMMFFALAALAFAVVDQVWVRREFAKRMRMSRRELKREHRDREGEPRQKQKRKQLHGELAKAVRALRAVKGADVILTNPTHYAVALRYDPATMQAPHLVARGAGEMARRIRSIAFTYGVPTISDPALTRALFRSSRTGSEIPSAFYEAVAGHYRRRGLGQQQGAA
ncbi:MAG: flagellar type III secretion system protein FlhB [Sphingomonadales bacterium]|nr:flagellar type III secretion system protein FlhB [Sphingomonadales bacterium]